MKWNVKAKSFPKLRNPILVEGLPGIGNVGKVCVEYLVDKLGAKELAELFCGHFPYHVFINPEDLIELPRNEIFYYRNKSKKKSASDIILLTGDVQSMTPHGHYDTAEAILDFLTKSYKLKLICTLGGFGGKTLPKKTRVIGAVTEKKLVKKYKPLGIKFEHGRRVGMIIGASGLLLGLGHLRGIPGICLMGETISKPMFADTKSAQEVLKILTKLLGIRVDMNDLEKQSKKLDHAIRKAKEIEKRMLAKLKHAPSEELRYIG